MAYDVVALATEDFELAEFIDGYQGYYDEQGFNDFKGKNSHNNRSGLAENEEHFERQRKEAEQKCISMSFNSATGQVVTNSLLQQSLLSFVDDWFTATSPEGQAAIDGLRNTISESPENAELVNSLLPTAARDENGQIFATEDEKIAWEEEHAQSCSMNATAETMTEWVNDGTASDNAQHLNQHAPQQALQALPGT